VGNLWDKEVLTRDTGSVWHNIFFRFFFLNFDFFCFFKLIFF